MRDLAGGEGVAMRADAGAGSQFGADVRVGQRHRIIARMRDLAPVVEARAVAGARLLRVAGFERHRVARHGHDEKVAEVAVPRTREMRVREALDRRVAILVARGMRVTAADHAAGVGIRRQLNHPERRRRTRIGVAAAAGADHRIDRVIGGARNGGGGTEQGGGEREAGDHART